ncbi:MAG: GvpL/GvpF family gas vesicle protein [Chloroherpetonaceae bacterium]|nr:GvpL/GvpF family gas vesicle protein [Chloroherpetonaceae bacterium]
MNPEELIYLYAIVDAPVAVSAVRMLKVQELYVAVANVSWSEFNETALQANFRNLSWLEERARQHEAVIEAIMQHATVVPCRFPTLFYSESAAQVFVSQHYEQFVRLIEKFRGKEEWGVKVYSQSNALCKAVVEMPELKAMDADIAQASAGKAFLLRKQREKRLGELLHQYQGAVLEELFQSLRQWAVETKQNPVLPKDMTGQGDEMILNAALLVACTNTKAFLADVEAIGHKLSQKGLRLEISGPWAAYNFCTMPTAHLSTEK